MPSDPSTSQPLPDQRESQIFPWYWCEDCEEEFQETGVDDGRCPFCGSKNIERDPEESS